MRGDGVRKLAAIDILFLGYKLILAEYAAGVSFSLALGMFVLLRSHSFWEIVLGVYLVCLGINYVPMLVYAIAIGNRQNAQTEISDELINVRRAMSKYRRQSLLLPLPLLVPILAVSHKLRSE